MDGIKLTHLNEIFNENGTIFHIIKSSDKEFSNFGEAYFSSVNKDSIKGWKKHKKMILNLAVVVGEIQFVIFNPNINKFFEVKLSKDNYKRLTIKNGMWVAFRGMKKNNILINIASIEHDPSESENMNLDIIKYKW